MAHAPVLTVKVTGGQSDYVGKQVMYKIRVTNTGDATAMNSKVQIAHSSKDSGTVTAAGIDSSGSAMLGDLAPNASKTIDSSATSTAGGTVTVIASASADCAAM